MARLFSFRPLQDTRPARGAPRSISTRTVPKHLQHGYVKLGVETRTAAVVCSMGWMPAGDAGDGADAGRACQAPENAL